MRKFLISALFLYSAVFAQEKKNKFGYGIKGGMAGTIITSEIFDLNYRYPPFIGAFFASPQFGIFNIKAEALFLPKGAVADIFDTIADFNKINLNYFSFPAYLQTQPLKRLKINVGVQTGYLLFGNKIIFDRGATKRVSLKRVERLDLALAAGIEVELREGFTLQGSYIHSLQPITASSNELGFNRAFTLSVNINFNSTLFDSSKVKKQKAHQHIVQLKKGALLVRLNTYRRQFEALEGRLKKASDPEVKKKIITRIEQLKADRQVENQGLVSAFKGYYDFTPVYFFYDTSSYNIPEGNRTGYLLNENLKVDSSITVTEPHLYVAELALSELPDFDLQSNGLLIRDKKLNQLEYPFPSFVDTYFTIDSNPAYIYNDVVYLNSLIKVANRKLWKFYR